MANDQEELEQKVKSRRNRSRRRKTASSRLDLDYALIAEAESYSNGLSSGSHDLQRDITAYRLSVNEFREAPSPEFEGYMKESEQRLRRFIYQHRKATALFEV